MKRQRSFITILVICLLILGLYFVQGYCQQAPPQPPPPVTAGDEASPTVKLPPGEDPSDPEDEDEDGEDLVELKTQETEKKYFKFGGANIKLMLIQPTPLFATELFSVPEEEKKR